MTARWQHELVTATDLPVLYELPTAIKTERSEKKTAAAAASFQTFRDEYIYIFRQMDSG